jgi:L-fuconolactonase
MFGSDWPVCKIAGEYEQVLEVVERFTDRLSKSEKEAIMGNTAAEFYGISTDS